MLFQDKARKESRLVLNPDLPTSADASGSESRGLIQLKLGLLALTFNPSTQEAEAVDLLVQSQPSLPSGFQDSQG